uniref:CCHC-type domain-containing protein n=1 Tax=Tanacetum cinerariifolium TaxID=118510 RepID=A0A6L2LVQ0_TANCI|nr:hypothetical protein [Tanacetum cinerariifolium]
MLYDGNVIAKETNAISIVDSKETLMLEEESRSNIILKQNDPMVFENKVNTKPIDYIELNRLFEDFGEQEIDQDSAHMVAASKVSMLKPVNTANGVSTTSTQVNAAFATNIANLSDVVTCAFLASQPNSLQLAHKDLEQIHPYDIEDMNLRWQMEMLTVRARRFLKKTGRKLTVNGNENLGFDTSKLECYKCHKRGHFARECRSLRNQDFKNKESTRRTVHVEKHVSTALVSCDGLGGYDWSDQAEEGPNYTLMAYTSSTSDSKMSLLLSLYKSSKEKTKAVIKNTDASIIEEWVSDDEEKNVTQPKIVKKTVRPNIVNTARQVNIVHQKTTVNAARPISYLSTTVHSTVKRPIQKNTTFKKNINKRVNIVRSKTVNTARPKAVVNDVKRNHVNAVKAPACWV